MPKAPPTLRLTPLAPRSQAPDIHRSRRWRLHSERMRREYPLCMAPFCLAKEAGNWPTSTSVHHIYGAARFPRLAYVDSNTCPVCSTCHAKVEGMERAGQPTQHLFANWMEQDA